jgi:hypothetical protein
MDGDTVQDWWVSPKLVLTGASGMISLATRVSAMSYPPEVYYGVWISYGSKNPVDGDYTEVADLSEFPVTQGVWVDTAINTVYTGDTAYVAIKYRANNYAWLMVWIDDISVDSAILAPTAGLPEAEQGDAVQLFPNPTTGKVTLSGVGLKTIEVMDVCGKLVTRLSCNEDMHTFDLSDYPTGLYFLRITDDNECSIRKVMLQ